MPLSREPPSSRDTKANCRQLAHPILVVDLALPKKSMGLLNQWDLEDYAKLCKTGKVAQIEMQVHFSLLSLTNKFMGKGIGVARLRCTRP